MRVLTTIEKEIIQHKGEPMLLDKISELSVSETGKKPQVRGAIYVIHGLTGWFLGTMEKQVVQSYVSSGLNDLLFPPESQQQGGKS